MTSNVVDIDDYKPHISVVDKDNNVRIIPKQFFLDVIYGKRQLTDLEEHEKIIPQIIEEWLEGICN